MLAGTVADAAGQFIGTYITLERHNQPVAYVCIPFYNDRDDCTCTDENMKSVRLESGQLVNVIVTNRTL